MKEYDVFIHEVMNRMQQKLGNGFYLHIEKLSKDNGIKADCLVISTEGEKMSECINLKCYYRLCVSQEDMDMIAADMMKTYRKARQQKQAVQEDELLDWNQARKRIMFRLVSTEANRELLKDMPHTNFCDLSQVFYLFFETDGDGCQTVPVTDRLMEMWKVGMDEILLNAERNTTERMPWKLARMNEILNALDREFAPEKRGMPFYVLTNSMKLYGAGCILYNGMLEKVAERIGFGFYVLPISVHELIIVPSDQCRPETVQELKGIVKFINDTELPECDILSESVYYYDRKEHLFMVEA